MQDKNKILDELLIMRMRDGDSTSTTLFVKRWHSKLIWYSFQLIHNKEESQDIVQENWPRIIEGITNLKEIRSYRSWMYRVIRNKTIDKIRKSHREASAIENAEINDISTTSTNQEQNLDLMKKLISKLPSELKEILHLFYLQENTVEEIGQILQIPNGTVKSRLYRAREQVKSLAKQVEHLFEF